jgi:hypothetical protein
VQIRNFLSLAAVVLFLKSGGFPDASTDCSFQDAQLNYGVVGRICSFKFGTDEKNL